MSDGRARRAWRYAATIGLAAAVCAGRVEAAQTLAPEWHETYEQAQQFYEAGQLAQALPVAERSLRMAKRLFGLHMIQTADALELLGHIHDGRGRILRALFFYQRALAIREQTLGVIHPQVADTAALLAQLYAVLGQEAQAAALFERVRIIHEAAAAAAAAAAASGDSTIYGSGRRLVPPQSLVSLEQPRVPAADRYAEPSDGQAAAATASTRQSGDGLAAGVGSGTDHTRPVWHQDDPLEADAKQRPSTTNQGLSHHDLGIDRGSSATRVSGETAQMRSLKIFAESLIERAVAYIQAGIFYPADELLREALAISDRLYGVRSPRALELLAPAADALKRAGRPEEVQALETRLRKFGGDSGTSGKAP